MVLWGPSWVIPLKLDDRGGVRRRPVQSQSHGDFSRIVGLIQVESSVIETVLNDEVGSAQNSAIEQEVERQKLGVIAFRQIPVPFLLLPRLKHQSDTTTQDCYTFKILLCRRPGYREQLKMEPTSPDTTIMTARRTTTFLVSILVALCSGTNYVCNLVQHAGNLHAC